MGLGNGLNIGSIQLQSIAEMKAGSVTDKLQSKIICYILHIVLYLVLTLGSA